MKKISIAAHALLVGLALAGPAQADELRVAAGIDGEGTSWSGDGAGLGTLGASYLFNEHIGAYFVGRSGYAAIEERALQRFDLGVLARLPMKAVVPYVRGGLLHQHEISRDAMEAQPVANLLGWGDGIRHRGGVGLRAGLGVPIADHKSGDVALVVEAGSSYFLNPEDGPLWYWGGGVALELGFDLAQGGSDGR